MERDRDTTARDLQTGEPWESIRFTTVGTTPEVLFIATCAITFRIVISFEIYDDLIHEARQLAQKRDSEQTVIYTSWGHHVLFLFSKVLKAG